MPHLLVTILLLCSTPYLVNAGWEFTNVQCDSLNKTISDVTYCYLRSINRTYKYISARIKLHQTPITNMSFNMELKKKANGYKPFLYNISTDLCKFLKTRSNPVIGFFYDIIRPYSNLNHTCPLVDDLIVEKLPISHLNSMLTQVLPLPHGDYAIFSKWFILDVPFLTANAFTSFK